MTALNTLNVTAKTIDLVKLNTIIKDLRTTQKVLETLDADRALVETKLEEAKSNLQHAADTGNYDDIAKYNTTCKRLKAVLAESPIAKLEAFDKAVNELAEFVTSQVTDTSNVQQLSKKVA